MVNSREVFVHRKGALLVDREKARDQRNPPAESGSRCGTCIVPAVALAVHTGNVL